MSREARYRTLFNLAWDNHGLTLVLNDVPDAILKQMVQWRNEAVEAEKAALNK